MKDTLPDRVRLGVFEVDLRAGELRQGERTVRLHEQPFQVLRMLVERSGEIVTREEIQKKLWPNDTVVEFDHSINAAINKLRQALGDSADAPRYVETVARRGYRLLVPVERAVIAEDDSSASMPLKAPAKEKEAWVEYPPESSILIGKKVSHYRVLSVIGGGGMGLVYEAEDLKLGRRVALKFLPEELASDPVAMQRFEREAQTASSLNHPNICTVYEIEEYEKQSCIVMELLQGQTLRDWLASAYAEQKALPLKQVLDVAIQVADGLQAAHEKGIVHRDIKPANIFLTTSGQVKILDFGVAKLVVAEQELEKPSLQNPVLDGAPAEPDRALTRTGLAMGTVGYMSPEQVRGEKLDVRTDIFSFGLVLYEMVAGKRPFSGETAAIVRDAILNQKPVPAHEHNSAVPRRLEEIINRAIEKDRELRYQTAAEMRTDLQPLLDQSRESESGKPRMRSRWKWLAAAAVVGVAMIPGGLYWRSHKPAKLTDKDPIVLADFDNKTGDAVFDDTLKQGLSVQLGQSPFLDLVSDRKVSQTLREMGRQPTDRLTPEVTREVCVRSGSKIMLIGSIVPSGHEYVIRLKAVDCSVGDSVAEVQERAADKEAVLAALDKAATRLRSKLGESLDSVEKYAMPLQEATTPSLEALRAYSTGWRVRLTKGTRFAIPFYQRAIELDPNFAAAFNQLALMYGNTNQGQRAEEYTRRAYELRSRVSERERFAIEANYYDHLTGELGKAAQTYELWQQTYPTDFRAVSNLGGVYCRLGNMEKYLEQARAMMRMEPHLSVSYEGLANAYINLNRLDEAEEMYKQGQQRLEGGARGTSFLEWYELAFLKGDEVQMMQMAAAARGQPLIEDRLLADLAETEAWHGRFKNSRKLMQQAIDFGVRNDTKETSALYLATTAVSEVPAVNPQQARADAAAALKLSQNQKVNVLAALALAQAGDVAAAQKVADELDKTYPLSTVVQDYWLPTVRAAVALQRKDPNRAVELLKVASAIELGVVSPVAALCPVYVRGEAYLTLGDGKAAAAEFQKFIDHYGLVGSFTWGALARLGLARASALDAATDPAAREKARTAYQNFLTLWKDADPDIPIYKQAKAEYAKLR